jgi:hypothetical protein
MLINAPTLAVDLSSSRQGKGESASRRLKMVMTEIWMVSTWRNVSQGKES